MNRRAGLLVLAATALAPLFSGCGGSDDTPFPPPAQQNVLSLPTARIPAGVATAVEVRLENPANVAGVQGRILYDASVVEVVDPATLGNGETAFDGSILPGGATINYEVNRTPVNGRRGVTFAIGNPTAVNTSGRLLRLWFRPVAGAAANATTTLTLDPAFPFLMAGPQGEVLTSHSTEGSLTVGP